MPSRVGRWTGAFPAWRTYVMPESNIEFDTGCGQMCRAKVLLKCKQLYKLELGCPPLSVDFMPSHALKEAVHRALSRSALNSLRFADYGKFWVIQRSISNLPKPRRSDRQLEAKVLLAANWGRMALGPECLV